MAGEQDELIEAALSRIGVVLQNKWTLEDLLGVGGFAAVYSAKHRSGKRVAVKVLHSQLAMRKSVRERFVREAYAANAIEHPGVVSVLDDDATEEGAPYLVMELLNGETLEARRIRLGGRLLATEVLSVADAVLDVLAVAHGLGIVHRDLKPENLFLTRGGGIRVLDFGIAKLHEVVEGARVTESGVPMGTPAFMPPEQARGRWSEVDARSDLWAVGATMFTLLAGRIVHQGGTAAETLVAAMTAHAPPLAEVLREADVELTQVVDRALAFEPADRWTDARTMQGAVRRAYCALTGTDEPTVRRLPALGDDATDPGAPVDPHAETARALEVGASRLPGAEPLLPTSELEDAAPAAIEEVTRERVVGPGQPAVSHAFNAVEAWKKRLGKGGPATDDDDASIRPIANSNDGILNAAEPKLPLPDRPSRRKRAIVAVAAAGLVAATALGITSSPSDGVLPARPQPRSGAQPARPTPTPAPVATAAPSGGTVSTAATQAARISEAPIRPTLEPALRPRPRGTSTHPSTPATRASSDPDAGDDRPTGPIDEQSPYAR